MLPAAAPAEGVPKHDSTGEHGQQVTQKIFPIFLSAEPCQNLLQNASTAGSTVTALPPDSGGQHAARGLDAIGRGRIILG